jgi:hypothetical protein
VKMLPCTSNKPRLLQQSRSSDASMLSTACRRSGRSAASRQAFTDAAHLYVHVWSLRQ